MSLRMMLLFVRNSACKEESCESSAQICANVFAIAIGSVILAPSAESIDLMLNGIFWPVNRFTFFHICVVELLGLMDSEKS